MMGKMFDAKVAKNGRLVLPRQVREALGMADGGTVIFSVEDGEIKLTSLSQNVERARAIYRRYVTAPSSVDEFLAERRAQVAREDEA